METPPKTVVEVPDDLDLERLRKWCGFQTQRPAAEVIGISQPRLDQIEADGCDRIPTAEKIAAAYNVDTAVVLRASNVTKSDKNILSKA